MYEILVVECCLYQLKILIFLITSKIFPMKILICLLFHGVLYNIALVLNAILTLSKTTLQHTAHRLLLHHTEHDGKRRRPDRVKKPLVKIPVDLVTDF